MTIDAKSLCLVVCVTIVLVKDSGGVQECVQGACDNGEDWLYKVAGLLVMFSWVWSYYKQGM